MAKKYNCEINGTNYYKKRKTIGRDINNKPIIKYFYGDGEKDVDRKINDYMNLINKGVPSELVDLSIEQLMNKWIWDVLFQSKDTKSASFDKHETNYRLYIKNSDIGFLKVSKISTMAIQKYYNKLFNDGIIKYNRKGEKEFSTLSTTKITDINKTLRSFFNYAIKLHIITDNPCSLTSIKIPGNADGFEDEEDEEKIIAFDDEDLKTILDNLSYINGENNTFNVSTKLALITGLRKGELLGLKRKYVDLDKCEIRVRNTLKLVKEFTIDKKTGIKKYKRVLKLISPKSITSKRTIPFPVEFKPILKAYFLEQINKYDSLGLKFNEDSLIFTTNTCKPIEAKNHTRSWERFLNKSQVAYRKFHSTRDTYATSLIRRGANIFEVKELLGHSSITITEKYYIYCFPEDKSKTVNLISDFIGPSKTNGVKMG